MEFLAGFSFLLLGLIFGSFFNVVLFRYGSGQGILGRSACLSCGRTLIAIDLVPVVSFFVLGGACRSCGSRLSWQYPAVEALTGFLFLLVYTMHLSIPETILWLLVVSLSVLIVVYDVRHFLIPDTFSYLLVALGFLSLFVSFEPLGIRAADFFQFLAGPLLALPLLGLWFLSRGAWLGLADAKLELGIGFLLGMSHGIAALFIAFLSGALIGLLLLLYARLFSSGKHFTMKSELPFAPFLILGMLAVLFTGISAPDILVFLSNV